MKRSSKLSKSSESGQSFGVGLESLEDRQFMSGDVAGVVNQAKAQLSASVSAIIARIEHAFSGASSSSSSSGSASSKTTTKKADPAPKTVDEALARLRADAALLSSSKAAVAQAIKQLGQADPAAGYEAGKRILIAENLGLPSDALKSKLSATELIEHVSELEAAGGQEQQSSVAYWQTVNTKGADAALAGVVVSNLGIPPAAVVGKTAKQIVDDAGNINLLTGDVRSVKAWQGLGLLKSGKISVEQYAKDYTDASDVGKGSGTGATSSAQQATQTGATAKAAKDAVGATGIADRVTSGSVGNGGSGSNTAASGANTNVSNNAAAGNAGNVQTTTPPPAATTNTTNTTNTTTQPPVTNAPPASSNTSSGADTAADNTQGQIVGTISNVHNEGGTSTYTLTTTYPNGNTSTAQVTVYPDGSATVVNEDGPTNYPAGSADPMSEDAEGQTIVLSEDNDGDGSADSGTYYPPSDGSGDGSDDNGDDDDDNNNGDNANTDTTPPPADSQGDGSGGGGTTAPAASGEPTPDTDTSDPQKKDDFYQNNPIGRSVAGSMSPTSGPTGGAGDPEDPGTNPAARQAFEDSPLGSKGKGVRVLGGAIDYPDGERSTSIVVDARQLQSIAIRAGGAVGGPEAGKPVTVAGGGNTGGGVIPTTPIKGGGGTASASSASTSATVNTSATVATFSTVRVAASVSSLSNAAISAKVSTAVFAK